MQQYTCPMHPEIVQNHPGKCPKCGDMQLVKVGEAQTQSSTSYTPLFVIIGLIVLVSACTAFFHPNFLPVFMNNFMAGFFLVFAGFKLLDLRGFATAYSTYDLIAARFKSYGFVYPFIELLFGIGYVFAITNPVFHLVVLIVMGVSGVGVLHALMKKRKFQCACLGTAIKLPLTKVTLIEDFGMALMACLMLFWSVM